MALKKAKEKLVFYRRILFAIVGDMRQGELTLYAMALVYKTLLSMVPFFALSFSVLKSFGVHLKLRSVLLNYLAPLGENSEQIADNIISFVNQMDVGILGSVGLVLLLYTTITLVQMVERSFNNIWQVAEMRSFSQSFTIYLSTIVIGPVLIFSIIATAISFTNTRIVQYILNLEHVGPLLLIFGNLIPILFTVAIFTFAFKYIPNTYVPFRPALVGGVVTTILWQIAEWGFTSFITASTQYFAIYSSFAILILFLLWISYSWQIVLVGASITFYLQYPEQLETRHTIFGSATREQIALSVMYLVGKRFDNNEPPWTFPQLVHYLRVSTIELKQVIDALKRHGLLVPMKRKQIAYIPAYSLEKMKIESILNAVRETDGISPTIQMPVRPEVDRIFSVIQKCLDTTIDGMSLSNLLAEEKNQGGREHEEITITGVR